MSIVDDLRTAGAARVFQPGEPGYAEAVAGFDTGVEMAPPVVVEAQGAAEVAAAVDVAAQHGSEVTVLGAGHGRLRAASDGLAIAMRSLHAVEVDAAARTARIEGGCTWEPVLAAATPLGLAPVCGSAPGVGVAGYLLGGGLGPLASGLGYSSDYLRSADVVTPADGLITVSADTNADLFWALRGGKGGFGVVTSVTVELPALDRVFGGGVYFAAEDAAAVLHAYAAWAPRLPEASTTSVALLRLPPLDALPEEIRGKRVVHARFASLDSADGARAQLADLRAVARPLLDTVGPLPYGELGRVHGDPTAPMPVANGAAALAALDGEAVDAVLGAADLAADLPLSAVEIRTLGSATRVAPPPGDAVGGRGTPQLLNVYAAPIPGLADGERLAAARRVLDATAPWHADVQLVNFVGRANDASDVDRCWSAEQNDQLDRIRDRHDPERLFRFARHTPSPGDAVGR